MGAGGTECSSVYLRGQKPEQVLWKRLAGHSPPIQRGSRMAAGEQGPRGWAGDKPTALGEVSVGGGDASISRERECGRSCIHGRSEGEEKTQDKGRGRGRAWRKGQRKSREDRGLAVRTRAGGH